MAAPDLPADKAERTPRASKRPLIMRYAARSDVGRVRAKNDDSAYVGRHLAVVADGMGGHAGGDVASAATVLDMLHLDSDGYDGDAGTILADEIQTANSLLSELVHMNPKLAGMGTTVTALLLAEGKLHFAHIGDSRAYRLRNGEYEQISVDHTFVQRLIDEGRLRPEEAETHPHKNVLMRVLGDVDASPELDLATLEVEPGERWLLCSDGLNYVAGHVVERTVRETRDLRECAELLVDLTLEAGAPDNVTVVMLEITEQTTDDVRTAAVDVVPSTPLSIPGTTAGTATDPQRTGSTFGAAKTVQESGGPADPEESVGPTEDHRAENAGRKAEPGTATDPHLGEHLSAEVLREELAGRPHELVGAAAIAAASGSIPTVAGRTMARRAATVLTHKSEQTKDEVDVDSPAVRPRRWLTISIAAAIVAVLTVGLWLGYAWTQTRYYIGEHDQHVAIFNGVSQRLGPIQLSTLETVTEIRMSDLPEFSQQRVRQTVPARDLYDAQRIVKNLERTGTTAPADECITASPTPTGPTPTATPGDTASPGTSGTATPSPAATVPLCEAVK
ncbi:MULTISPECIES: PP2C family protein-serine/threonine phosphatase [unclassified Arthrobacter]|uniref:PP2C family protein-serine/threonine phosphatase n=1 Tax=unclassified Arthrobacter TaxID=235627 RepID=UPI002E0AAB62|nr:MULTISPECIES: PP2C family serine/threonine-protein phosphatase [unclassified Arthrobacter]MEC5192787.1 serine/threonine protein phosphatase PrpC [Arthrobacter sp. MP_M4]MEC5204328.1 serine/threonine protein phosphatase PrpC [Arthrobacter sp. MP_M7]